MHLVFKNKDTFFGLFFLILSLYLLCEIQTFAMPAEKIRSLGPEFFPDILASSMALLSGVLTVQGLRAPRGPILPESWRGATLIAPLAYVAGAVSFMLLVSTLGFLLWSVLFLAAMQYLMGERRPARTLFFACAVSAVIYVVFATCLRVPLPQGLFGF